MLQREEMSALLKSPQIRMSAEGYLGLIVAILYAIWLTIFSSVVGFGRLHKAAETKWDTSLGSYDEYIVTHKTSSQQAQWHSRCALANIPYRNRNSSLSDS